MDNSQHIEALLLETLLSGLDAQDSAKRSGSQMLLYLANMLVQRAREELGAPPDELPPNIHAMS